MARATQQTAVLALLAVLAGPGCTTTASPGPARPAQAIETSYPSPDLPPPSGTDAPAPGAAGLGAPVLERSLAGPVPAAPAPAPVVRPVPASPPDRPSPPPAADGRFEAMDADRTGRVTLEEWRGHQEREFRRLDANNDGVLTREELGPPGKSSGSAARPMP
ncbi:EF-hand domain-containing protein [Solidesulfovibrio sp.]